MSLKMASGSPNQVTELLDRIRDGDGSAADRLLPLVYDELRALASHVFGPRKSAHTLQPTALVHEAWMRLAGGLGNLNDRVHFFRVAARAMRQVLADYARAERAQKRGGGVPSVTLDDSTEGVGSRHVDLVALDDSLSRLAELNDRHAKVVTLRLFGSLSIDEVAHSLGVSHATVESDWAFAKAWLRKELAGR
jgi:RNA polymerase sigma-70 factor (ECF subfamily)